MIIVAFTSWKKRIDNVAKVALNIINQTIKPDLIELNLSIEEFPNREADLPKELNFLIAINIHTTDDLILQLQTEKDSMDQIQAIVTGTYKRHPEDDEVVIINLYHNGTQINLREI